MVDAWQKETGASVPPVSSVFSLQLGKVGPCLCPRHQTKHKRESARFKNPLTIGVSWQFLEVAACPKAPIRCVSPASLLPDQANGVAEVLFMSIRLQSQNVEKGLYSKPDLTDVRCVFCNFSDTGTLATMLSCYGMA